MGTVGRSPKVFGFLSITPYVESNDVASTNSSLSFLGGMRAAGPWSSELLRHAPFFLFSFTPSANNNILMLQPSLAAVLPSSRVFPVRVWTRGQFYNLTQYSSSFMNSFSSLLTSQHLWFNILVRAFARVLWRIATFLTWQKVGPPGRAQLLDAVLDDFFDCFLHLWLLWKQNQQKKKTHLALERHGPLVGETWPWASPLPAGWSVGLADPRWVLLDHFSHWSRLFQLSAMFRGGHGTWMTHQ